MRPCELVRAWRCAVRAHNAELCLCMVLKRSHQPSVLKRSHLEAISPGAGADLFVSPFWFWHGLWGPRLGGGLWGRWYPGIQVATSAALGVAGTFCAFAAAGDRGMRMRVIACLWVCVNARWAWRVWRACSARWPWMCSTCCACIHCWRRRWCFVPDLPPRIGPCSTTGIFRFQARWGSESPSAAPNHAMTMALHAHRSELSLYKPDSRYRSRYYSRICKRFATHR